MPAKLICVHVTGRASGIRAAAVTVSLVLAVSCSGDKASTPSGISSAGRAGVAAYAGRGGAGQTDAPGASGSTGVAGSDASAATGLAGSGTSGAGATSTGGTAGILDAGVMSPSDAGSTAMDADTTQGGQSQLDASLDAGVDASVGTMLDASMGTDEDDAGETVCMPLAKPLDVSSFPKCSTDVCPAQDSVCVPGVVLTQLMIPAASIALLADCDAMNKCVPVALASQAGRQILPSCVSVIGAEGRCLSRCVPQVASQASLLPKDTCTGTDLCAPCYDPRTGASTSACSQGCDPGPTQAPKVFAHCCSDRGRCVPPSLAGEQVGNLQQDTCADGTLCSPTELTDPAFKPKSCSSIDGAEGRCLSNCIGGSIAQQRDRLPTAGCGEAEVCAPCFDPITGDSTGACAVNGDKPLQPAYKFDRCCDNGAGTQVGVCVTSAMAGSQASMLRADSCANDRLCAPIKRAIDPNAKFARCTGLGAGACVPSCILDPIQARLLTRTRCEVGEVCAPCAALGLISTGACD